MALLQTVQLEHLPATHQIHIALYRNVKNSAFLHQQLLAGNSDFEYALIDASVVSSSRRILFPAPSFCTFYHILLIRYGHHVHIQHPVLPPAPPSVAR